MNSQSRYSSPTVVWWIKVSQLSQNSGIPIPWLPGSILSRMFQQNKG